MKLGNGSTNYVFKFRYKNTGRTSIKNVYADTYGEAKELFNKEYKGYKIEILQVYHKE